MNRDDPAKELEVLIEKKQREAFVEEGSGSEPQRVERQRMSVRFQRSYAPIGP